MRDEYSGRVQCTGWILASTNFPLGKSHNQIHAIDVDESGDKYERLRYPVNVDARSLQYINHESFERRYFISLMLNPLINIRMYACICCA